MRPAPQIIWSTDKIGRLAGTSIVVSLYAGGGVLTVRDTRTDSSIELDVVPPLRPAQVDAVAGRLAEILRDLQNGTLS